MFNKRTPLAQTQSEFEQQAVDFLQDNGIDVAPGTLALFAAAIQHGDQAEDTFEPKKVAKAIRKAIATRLAFYLIHPEKKPKEEPVAAGDTANELKD